MFFFLRKSCNLLVGGHLFPVFGFYFLGGNRLIFLFHTGDNMAILRSELKSQRKLVKNLKKKSLWSKSLEEVIFFLPYDI